MTKYEPSNEDLPEIFGACNPVTTAKTRIYAEAKMLGVEISPDELRKFAVLLVAIEQD